MEKKVIRLSKSCLSDEEKKAVLKVLDNEFLGMGNDVKLFEEELAQFFGISAENVVCTNTGTAALHLALASMDIGLGDEVLVPSLTYLASFQAISATGAIPVACDINEATLFIDINDARKRLTSKTKAIMPVHYASSPLGMEEVYNFAKANDLRVVEDAAHSFGSYLKGKKVGSFGDTLCFSFDGIKNITSGEGGAIVSFDESVLKRSKDGRLLSVEDDSAKRAKNERTWKPIVKYQGFRYHMSNVMAAIGLAQLRRFKDLSEKRQMLVQRYLHNLIDESRVKVLDLGFSEIVSHIFVVKILGGKREYVFNGLVANKIQCGLHYYPNHLLDLYRTSYSLPVTENIYSQILTLPLHPDLSLDDVDNVCSTLKRLLAEA